MKNYVSKLNDRNLQRKRESGLTTYVLYSIVVLICYKIFELYPLIPFKNSFWEILSILACTFNIILGFLLIRMTYSETTNYASSLRIILNSNNSYLLDECLVYSLLLIPLISNICTVILNHNNNFENIYFIVMSIVLFLFLLIIVVYFFDTKRVKENEIEVYNGTGKKNNDRDKISVALYLISLFLIIYSLIILFNSSSDVYKTKIFLFGILFYSLPCLLLKILELRENDNFTIALENLEYEINVRELSNEEIRIRLQQNYYGFLIPDWINYNSQLFQDLILDVEKKEANIQKLEIELSKIDKNNYSIEYDGRLKIINELKSIKKNELNSFCSKKINEINSFWNNEEINNQERKEIFKFYQDLKSTLNNIDK